MKRIEVKPGDIYGQITIVEESESGSKHRKFVGKCSCGVKKEFYLDNLKKGTSGSCGCSRGRNSSKYSNSKRDSLYWVWVDIKQKADILEEGWESIVNFRNWAIENGYSSGLRLYTTTTGIYDSRHCSWMEEAWSRSELSSGEYSFVNPEGDEVDIYNLLRFCQENNLEYTSMVKVASGDRIQYRGWRLL